MSPPFSHLGTLGLLQALHHLLHTHDPVATPSLQELWCISGAASSLYVFDPTLNLPDARGHLEDFHPSGDLFSNYGVFEALAYTTGWDLKEINFISRTDLLSLVSFELARGRPVLSLGLGRSLLTPALIRGMDASHAAPVWQVQYATEPAPQAFDTAQMTWAQPQMADEEIWRNWCLIARPGARPEWAASLDKSRMQLLKWTVSHMHNPREFFHETQLNYATGIAALHTLERMAKNPQSPAHSDYLTFTLHRLHTAWSALADRLPSWASEGVHSPDLSCSSPTTLADALSQAADHYTHAASCIHQPAHTQFDPLIHHIQAATDALNLAVSTITTPL